MRSLALAFALSLAAALTPAAHAEERPNILFIFTDDHGVQSISAYGSQVNQTPNIDRLAAAGMRFDNCFVTNALCAPSRAVILTGKHSHINGQTTNDQTFDGAQPTFPKLLQQAGYQTALIGKWHLRSDPTGFDYAEILGGQGPYYNPRTIRTPSEPQAQARGSQSEPQAPARGAQPHAPASAAREETRHTGYTTDIITELAIDWLRSGRDADQPFLLMCQHKAPHRNWLPAERHLSLYADRDIPEPPTLFDDWSHRGGASAMQEMTIAEHLELDYDCKLKTPGELNDAQRVPWEAAYGPENERFRAANLSGRDLVRWKYQRFAKDYLRCVAAVDDSVGRLLDYLDESGLADNTIVVYSSDNGWFLGEHGWYDKRWMYEESLRVPLIVRWPGTVAAGSTSAALVQNLDFAPTFLELAGVPVPADMQGRSLVPLLKGAAPADWRASVYYHFYEDQGAHRVPRHYGVRTERYKLIHFYRLRRDDAWELYDLREDPDELRNVYADPRYARIIPELKAELERLRTVYKVTDEADRAYDKLVQEAGG